MVLLRLLSPLGLRLVAVVIVGGLVVMVRLGRVLVRGALFGLTR